LLLAWIYTTIAGVDIHGNLALSSAGYTAPTIDLVKDTHTKHRPIRVDGELWEAFGALVGDRNRSAVIRDFIRWFVGARGARLPRRPQKSTPSISLEVTGGREWLPPTDDSSATERVDILDGDRVWSIEINGDPEVATEFSNWLRANAGNRRPRER
jgi:hypothetical protein